MGYKKKSTRNVEMHGDLGRVRCVLCMTDYEARVMWMETFRGGEAPNCPACLAPTVDAGEGASVHWRCPDCGLVLLGW